MNYESWECHYVRSIIHNSTLHHFTTLYSEKVEHHPEDGLRCHDEREPSAEDIPFRGRENGNGIVELMHRARELERVLGKAMNFPGPHNVFHGLGETDHEGEQAHLRRVRER